MRAGELAFASIESPFFFLGIISSQRLDPLTEEQLPAGQFVYSHQYGGHSCNQAFMRGAFVPVESLSDNILRNRVLQFPQDYGLNSCEHDDMPVLQQEWRQLAGIDILPHGLHTGTSEALFRFEAGPLLDWLRPVAIYAIEFSQANDQFGGKVSKVERVEPLPWKSVEEFSRWLNAGGKLPLQTKVWQGPVIRYETRINDLVGAFVYENGD